MNITTWMIQKQSMNEISDININHNANHKYKNIKYNIVLRYNITKYEQYIITINNNNNNNNLICLNNNNNLYKTNNVINK